MKEARKVPPFSLRIREEVRETAEQEAKKYRRSLNAELGLLIEEGLKWREMQQRQAVA